MHAKWPNVVTFLLHQSLLTFQMLSTEHGLVACILKQHAVYKALPVMLSVIRPGVVIVLLAKYVDIQIELIFRFISKMRYNQIAP